MVIYGRIGTVQSYEQDIPDAVTRPGWAVMVGYAPNDNPSNFPFFEYHAQADGTWKYVQVPAPPKPVVWYDGRLQVDNQDFTFSPMQASAIPGIKRSELMSVALNASGVAVMDLTSLGYADFRALPQVTINASTARLIAGTASGKDITGANRKITITGRRTKLGGTVTDLLAGIMEPAAGETISVLIQEL